MIDFRTKKPMGESINFFQIMNPIVQEISPKNHQFVQNAYSEMQCRSQEFFPEGEGAQYKMK